MWNKYLNWKKRKKKKLFTLSIDNLLRLMNFFAYFSNMKFFLTFTLMKIFVFVAHTNGQIMTSTFDVFQNVKPDDDADSYLIAKYTTFDKITCLNTCNKQQSCFTVIYHDQDTYGNCKLYNKSINANGVNTKFTNLYKKRCKWITF